MVLKGIEKKENLLQILPAVDKILNLPIIGDLLLVYSRAIIVCAIRKVINNLRNDILSSNESNLSDITIDPQEIGQRVKSLIRTYQQPSLQKVINAKGVIIHTNLGRAPLANSALALIEKVASGYSNLEYSLDLGERGSRCSHIEELFFRLTNAEGVMVVNNNAAAVLLCLNTFAENKEVIISRGELVEIGGAFRIPDVMKKSNAILHEVGTTNRTYIEDYEKAINENTALLLKVHTSNYRIGGYTKEVSVEDLVKLGTRYNLPVMMDLGSGSLIDLSFFNLKDEPFISQVLDQGAQIVTFSGDKLLGGPQAGIILTQKIDIEPIRKNPLTRALRIDKLTLAALIGTLELYQHVMPHKEIPVLRSLFISIEELEEKAKVFASALLKINNGFMEISISDSVSSVGGGSLPLETLPTKAISLSKGKISITYLERLFKESIPPLLGRIHDDCFLLDLRTLTDMDLDIIVDHYREIVRLHNN